MEQQQNYSETPTHQEQASQSAPSQDLSSVDQWSWGAFMFSAVWGIGNRVWISLLAFIPFLNIIMMIVLGIKGKKWAWETGRFKTVDELNASQSTWDFAGKVFLALTIIGIILSVLGVGLIASQMSELQNLQQGGMELNINADGNIMLEQ